MSASVTRRRFLRTAATSAAPLWSLGMDAGGPEEVWVEGEPFIPLTSTAENPGGRQNGPITPSVRMRYSNGTVLEFSSGPKFGVVLVGDKAA